jgi:hypothetical protein
MLVWVWRLLLLLVTSVFVTRGALAFGVVDALVAVLIIGFAIVAAGLTLRRPPRDPL